MKTPDEIKKGLIWCIKGDYCKGCPYEDDCYVNLKNIPMVKEAFAYIQQLEAKDVKQAHRIAELEQELAAVKRERDAAVAIIGRISGCSECANADKRPTRCLPAPDDWCDECEESCVCKFCNELDRRWIWRGVCPENTEVQDDD